MSGVDKAIKVLRDLEKSSLVVGKTEVRFCFVKDELQEYEIVHKGGKTKPIVVPEERVQPEFTLVDDDFEKYKVAEEPKKYGYNLFCLSGPYQEEPGSFQYMWNNCPKARPDCQINLNQEFLTLEDGASKDDLFPYFLTMWYFEQDQLEQAEAAAQKLRDVECFAAAVKCLIRPDWRKRRVLAAIDWAKEMGKLNLPEIRRWDHQKPASPSTEQ